MIVSHSDEGEHETHVEPEAEAEPAAQPLRRSTRVRYPSSNLKKPRSNYNVNYVTPPIQVVCSFAHYPTEHQVFHEQYR